MKNVIKTILLTVLSILLVACCDESCEVENSPHEHDSHEHEATEAMYDHKELDEEDANATTYYCPMKCEQEKTYPKVGQCPVCSMSLEKVK